MLPRFLRFWFLAVLALCVLVGQVYGEVPAPPPVSIEWIDPPQELAQGKINVRVRLTANTDFRFPQWLADGQGPNFSVWIDRFPATGKPAALLPVVQRGIVSREPLTLYRGTSRELTGEFALNSDPGEYELFIRLGHSPETQCKGIRVRVIRGTVADVQK